METPRPALTARIAAILRTKQFLVFYAIALYSFGVATALLSAWLRRHQALAAVLRAESSPLDDLVAAGGAALVLLVVVSTLLNAWFRCAYLSSLTGGRRFAPRNLAQFWAMTALMLGSDGILTVLNLVPGGPSGLYGELALLAMLAVYLLTLYADYAIVIGNIGVVTALRRSWQSVRAHLLLSFTAVLVLTVVVNAIIVLLADLARDSLGEALALIVLQTFALGAFSFLVDVVLIAAYLEGVAAGKVDEN
ncbi:MAG: hypothetical protein ACLQUT_06995 [Thermoleophilia bacterium]